MVRGPEPVTGVVPLVSRTLPLVGGVARGPKVSSILRLGTESSHQQSPIMGDGAAIPH